SVDLTAFCLTHTKSCFGSCPTFYVGKELMAEGFSEAIAPSLEETDLDALYRLRPRSRELTVRIKNEALETHVVKAVRLVAARRPAGGRVFATPRGELWQAPRVLEPSACRAAEGDCLAQVRAFDGLERQSPADARDLAAREEIELEFPDPGARRLG